VLSLFLGYEFLKGREKFEKEEKGWRRREEKGGGDDV
tara:strand:- start:1172 stop:1282 length:111 start_codon:yes stop_codon:yes gene_type:complete